MILCTSFWFLWAEPLGYILYIYNYSYALTLSGRVGKQMRAAAMVLFGSPVMSIYIYISTLHCLCQKYCLDALIAVWTWYLWHHCLRYWMVLTSTASSISCCGWEVWGPESWVPPWLEVLVPRPHCTCFPVTCVYMSCSGWEAKVLCATSPAATGFSGAWGSAAIACGLEMQVQPPLFAPFCLPSGLVSPSWEVQMYGILWHPGVLGRGIFVELRMFYWLWI